MERREKVTETCGTLKEDGGDGSRWKRDESGRGRTGDGQEGPCATKVGTEVVVRNDNTSTDISIIHLRGTPRAIRYSETAASCKAFL